MGPLLRLRPQYDTDQGARQTASAGFICPVSGNIFRLISFHFESSPLHSPLHLCFCGSHVLEQLFNFFVWRGLQGGDPDDAGPDMKEALDEAMKYIPEEKWKHAPVFLTATAGMRLLPETERAHLLRVVNLWLADPENHPFLYGTKPPFDDGQFWAQT
eukprot:scaffold15712_cov40-Prasinocladus_malaysianus.AAC.1